MISYGMYFLANPDLLERFLNNSSLNIPDKSTFYSPGETAKKGYTDNPLLNSIIKA